MTVKLAPYYFYIKNYDTNFYTLQSYGERKKATIDACFMYDYPYAIALLPPKITRPAARVLWCVK